MNPNNGEKLQEELLIQMHQASGVEMNLLSAEVDAFSDAMHCIIREKNEQELKRMIEEMEKLYESVSNFPRGEYNVMDDTFDKLPSLIGSAYRQSIDITLHSTGPEQMIEYIDELLRKIPDGENNYYAGDLFLRLGKTYLYMGDNEKSLEALYKSFQLAYQNGYREDELLRFISLLRNDGIDTTNKGVYEESLERELCES